MARPCPRCRSRSVKHDRSLGGRAVCGACGLPLGSPWPGRANRSRARQRGLLVWLLLLGLMGGLVYLAANPQGLIPAPPAGSLPKQNSR